MDDAYWGERAKQALEGGLAGTDETMGRLQERIDASTYLNRRRVIVSG
ncbi:MAG: hypothetical protein PHO08_17255 [Methylococcales bacterium]|nr:hypothetical protein [Methylococcales bacterium]